MAELVDALASGASGLTAVKVRVLSWAPPRLRCGSGSPWPSFARRPLPGALTLYMGRDRCVSEPETRDHLPARGRPAGRRARPAASRGDRFGDHGPAPGPRSAVRGAALGRQRRRPCGAARPLDLRRAQPQAPADRSGGDEDLPLRPLRYRHVLAAPGRGDRARLLHQDRLEARPHLHRPPRPEGRDHASCSASTSPRPSRAPTGARPKLSEEQVAYAASDVLHLHALRARLDEMLVREGRDGLARPASNSCRTAPCWTSPAGKTSTSSPTPDARMAVRSPHVPLPERPPRATPSERWQRRSRLIRALRIVLPALIA